MSAFNPACEGPESERVSARTLQGIPGPPANLSFSEITMNSLKVSWDSPEKPNGEILSYIVAYEAVGLEPMSYYLFSVTAQTALGYTTNNRYVHFY